jgi:hypothetical protein
MAFLMQMENPFRDVVLGAASMSVIPYLFGLGLYRLYPSLIAKCPDPQLAALTQWHGFYYEVVNGGQFSAHIRELHKIYGEYIQ